jgi:hypothetical protein
MTIMISYARGSGRGHGVGSGPERAHMKVWVDRELTGGQVW